MAQKIKPSQKNRIITVGFCPCWDITCRVHSIRWGQHKRIASQTSVPAGKALNISKSLNWQGVASLATGLWGQTDNAEMLEFLKNNAPLITPYFTAVPGKTRQNITLIDTESHREMHLRADCQLSKPKSLQRLKLDLAKIITPADTVVFAGSMPTAHLSACISMIKQSRSKGAKIVIDSSGPALTNAVKIGGLYLIKPNLEELSELLGHPVRNLPGEIIKASRTLCDQVGIILVSRGKDGAIAITRDTAISCRVRQDIKAVNTVGCGDYLLAGFLAGIQTGDLCKALTAGVQAATARACGLSDKITWPAALRKMKVEISEYGATTKRFIRPDTC